MAFPGSITRSDAEIEKVRKYFVESPTQPSGDEILEKFAIPRSTLSKWMATEGWVALRAAYIENKARETDAMGIVIEAATSVNRPVIRAITDAVLSCLHGIVQAIQDVDPKRAPSTRVQVYNTASFAIKNISDACKNVGIVALGKKLAELGDSSEGWSPKFAQQLNITIGDIKQQAAAERATDIPIPPQTPANPP